MVLNLGVGKYFSDEVYGSLYHELVSQFLPLDDQGGAYHVVTCHDVKEEGFSPLRSDEDWGRR